MKITEEEREAAYELKWLIDEILMGRERAALYRETFVESLKQGYESAAAAVRAKAAIGCMAQAFEPVCPTCEQEAIEPRLAN